MSLLLKKIVDFILGIFEWIFDLIPDINLPFSALRFDFIGPVANLVGYLDSFIDLDVLVACVAIVIVFDNIGFITRLLKFILSKFGIG